MITQQQGYEKLWNTIFYHVRHKYYDECIEIAEYAHMVNSYKAEDQKEEIFRYRKGESKAEKNQRVQITNPITQVPLGMVYSYLEEVYRTDGIKAKSDHDNTKVKELVDANFSDFYQGMSLHEYIHKTLLHFNRYDPNAWIIFSGNVVGENEAIKIYPVLASCYEAIDFSMDYSGKLEYLTVMFSRTEVNYSDRGVEERTFNDFYLFGVGFTWHFAGTDGNFKHERDYQAEGYERINIADDFFFAQVFDTGTMEVPAIRAGAYLSGYHEMKIAETFVEAARPILNDLMGEKSLFDTQKIIHIFPEKNEYVRPCSYEDEDDGICEYGIMSESGRRCPACNGSGKLMVTSEQQVKQFAWPDDKDQMFDLSKVSYYVERPINIVEFYERRIDKLTHLVNLVVFNQQSIDQAIFTAKTATEVTIQADKINNKLAPFAQRTALTWELAQRVAYQMYGNDNPEADMTHPSDYKLKTILELVKEYEDAKQAGLPQNVLWSISLDILRKQHRNSPEAVKEIEAFERWKPWREKSNEEVFFIIQNRSNTDPDRVLWENWGKVKEQIKIDLGGNYFYLMPADQQRQMIAEQVGVLIEQIQYAGQTNLLDEPILGG